ncbi:hypothetical protein [Mycobacterium leprae]|nr:hypothetical protein [Mycobacterium leprae]
MPDTTAKFMAALTSRAVQEGWPVTLSSGMISYTGLIGSGYIVTSMATSSSWGSKSPIVSVIAMELPAVPNVQNYRCFAKVRMASATS